MPNITSVMISAATESPITWLNSAPRAAGSSATTVNSTAIASRLRTAH
jgi:hypothetical protein